MLTNNKIKLIKSLDRKKSRTESGCFLVEGEKMVRELLQSRFETVEVFAVQHYIDELPATLKRKAEITAVSERDLERISFLKTPNKAVALVRLPNSHTAPLPDLNGLNIALDNVQDPGNLGTIVRTAAWFGIKNVFCSPDTVDVYNPKVIQSTMGAIFKVNVTYCDLATLAATAHKANVSLFGTRLDGESIYAPSLPKNAIVVMGNESKGLSAEISALTDSNLKIPSYAPPTADMESLNVAVATAIVCAEFRRQNG
ncbi:MAG: RNA methyltransferase [Salinivirgaceae bacterium]|nr:RNA methyltransferase [Salinivirgaceae bacterium]